MSHAKTLLESTSQMLTSYTRDNEQARLMLLRFDEVMTDKANKSEIIFLEDRIK